MQLSIVSYLDSSATMRIRGPQNTNNNRHIALVQKTTDADAELTRIKLAKKIG